MSSRYPTITLSTPADDKGKTRRKLRESDLAAIRKDDPNAAIFRCVKIDSHQMAFWCPYCVKEHRHGWDPKKFVLSHRVPHCAFGKTPFSSVGYFVYWDGSERFT